MKHFQITIYIPFQYLVSSTSQNSRIDIAGLFLRDDFIMVKINLTAILRKGICYKESEDLKELTDRKYSHAWRATGTRIC